jgi:putative hydrolase of the HAD superfamily
MVTRESGAQRPRRVERNSEHLLEISDVAGVTASLDRPRALVFDVDGTLYYQGLLRACMALELLASLLTLDGHRRRRAVAVWRQLAVFRRTREALKGFAAGSNSLEHLQYLQPAQQVGCSPTELERVVTEWMHVRPLRYLAYCRRRGLVAFLQYLVNSGYRIAVLSDYPAASKLDALGAAPYVEVALCATDTTVNALKPHPRGFLQVCAALGLPPSTVLYVGDRADVDLAGARAAGMRCALIGRRMPWRNGLRHLLFPTFQKLQHELHL